MTPKGNGGNGSFAAWAFFAPKPKGNGGNGKNGGNGSQGGGWKDHGPTPGIVVAPAQVVRAMDRYLANIARGHSMGCQCHGCNEDRQTLAKAGKLGEAQQRAQALRSGEAAGAAEPAAPAAPASEALPEKQGALVGSPVGLEPALGQPGAQALA